MAYKELGYIVSPRSRAVSTSPSECYALRVLTGVVTYFTLLYCFLSYIPVQLNSLFARDRWRQHNISIAMPLALVVYMAKIYHVAELHCQTTSDKMRPEVLVRVPPPRGSRMDFHLDAALHHTPG